QNDASSLAEPITADCPVASWLASEIIRTPETTVQFMHIRRLQAGGAGAVQTSADRWQAQIKLHAANIQRGKNQGFALTAAALQQPAWQPLMLRVQPADRPTAAIQPLHLRLPFTADFHRQQLLS